MEQFNKFNVLKGKDQSQSNPLNGTSHSYSENILTPVTLNGVVVPWVKKLSDGRSSDHKLACASGVEYFIVADQEWREVLAQYCWEDVKVKGLLNVSNLTLIPQRVFPKGPTGDRGNVIDLATQKSRKIIKKLTKNINDLVFIPAAVMAVMA